MKIKAHFDLDLTEAVRHKLLLRSFAPLQAAQKRHEQCAAVDDLRLRYFVAVTMAHAPRPSPAEVGLLNEGLAILDTKDVGYTRIRGSLADYPTLALFSKNEKEGTWGKCTAQIDTTAENVVAWQWDFLSYNRMLDFKERNGDLPRSEGVIDSCRSKIMRGSKKFPAAVGHRIFENWWVWDKKHESNGDYYFVLSFAPTNEDYSGGTRSEAWSRSELPNPHSADRYSLFVKGTTRGVLKVIPIARNVCELTLCVLTRLPSLHKHKVISNTYWLVYIGSPPPPPPQRSDGELRRQSAELGLEFENC